MKISLKQKIFFIKLSKTFVSIVFFVSFRETEIESPEGKYLCTYFMKIIFTLLLYQKKLNKFNVGRKKKRKRE